MKDNWPEWGGDDYLENGIDTWDGPFLEPTVPNIQADDHRVWTSRDGTRFLYEDMNDGHLRNCIKLLRRRGCLQFYPNLTLEAHRRGLEVD